MRLTEISVRNLPIPEKGVKVHTDDTVAGFGVRCSQGGSKSFVLSLPGADRTRVTIGKVGVLGLAEARSVARQLLAEQTLGRHRPKRQTFSDALETFIETRKQRNRPKTAYETERLLKLYFKPLHAKQLDDIRAHHITDITDALSKKGLQSTASHAHTAVKTFLKFCAQRNYITSNPISEMEKPTLPKSRERVLTDDELRAVWKAAETIGGNFGKIVQLLALTGQRRSEIGSLKTNWINYGNHAELEKTDCEVRGRRRLSVGHTVAPEMQLHELPLPPQCTITIPANFTKNKRSHTFPIGQLASHLISNLSPQSFLFPARGKDQPFNGWSKAKAQLDKKVEEIRRGHTTAQQSHGIEPWTLHDLRRTFCTNLQRLGIRLEVIEALVNHVSGTRAGIVGVYQRHRYEAEMREAVETFESWFATKILSD